jgi:hypothetical protein
MPIVPVNFTRTQSNAGSLQDDIRNGGGRIAINPDSQLRDMISATDLTFMR